VKTLSINLGESANISSHGIELLSLGISELTTLQEFSINLGECNIENQALQALSLSLSNVKYLKKLSINCYKCKDIDKEGFEFLAELVSQLRFLTELTLNFSQCHLLGRFCLQMIKNSLKEKKMIKNVVVSLGDISYNLAEIKLFRLN